MKLDALPPPPATRPSPPPWSSPHVVQRCSARGALCITASLALATLAFLTCYPGDTIRLRLAEATNHAAPSLPPSSGGHHVGALLYAASYAGTIYTLNLTWSPPAPDAATASGYALDLLHTSDGCRPSPSWLTLDYPNSILYCTDEGLSADHGSVSVFDVSEDGFLSLHDRVSVIPGPVSAITYGDDDARGLAVAQYGGSSITWLSTSNRTGLSLASSKTFTLTEPGPVPSRQEAPHPHQVFLDPTGRFVLVPDLGADLVRVFSVGHDNLHLTEVEPLAAAPGSGPRHVDFLEADDGSVYMYLVTELANTVTGYRVSYPSERVMHFDRFFQYPTHGAGNEVPEGAAAAEITISPDGRFLTVSSRNEKSFAIPDPDSPSDDRDPKAVDSDSLITFAIDPQTGDLAFLQKFPAGGLIPRHFSFNEAGNLVAVALQQDARITVIERDVMTGQMRAIVASARLEGEVTAVIFSG